MKWGDKGYKLKVFLIQALDSSAESIALRKKEDYAAYAVTFQPNKQVLIYVLYLSILYLLPKKLVIFNLIYSVLM